MPTIEDPQIVSIRVTFPTPPIVRINVTGINATGLFADVVTIGNIRITSLPGPPSGGMIEVYDTDTNTWIEQVRYTE